MSAWFTRVGEPLEATEREQVVGYLRALALETPPVAGVADWSSAGGIIASKEWDPRWWDREQEERARLLSAASGALGNEPVTLELSRVLEQSIDTVHGAAAIHAARGGSADSALIRAAAGAVSQALYLGRLAELARAGENHAFSLKLGLFRAGRWPLGIFSGRYYLF